MNPILPLIFASGLLSPEAQTFLSSLPTEIQSRQAKAIEQACAGQPEALQAIRKERLKKASPYSSDDALAISNGTFQVPGRTLPYRVYTPRYKPEPTQTVLYLHGGGWVIGGLDSCDAFCAALAKASGQRVLSLAYRLAPEHPYPAAIEDARDALAKAQQCFPGQWIAAGDSAGGNLALALARTTALDGLLLFYPVVDAITSRTASWTKYARGFGLDASLMEAFNRAYAPENVRSSDALVSPARVPPEHLPPTLLVAAERDILADQGEHFTAVCTQRGLPIQRQVIPGSVHLFITVPGQPKARAEALASAVSFLRRLRTPNNRPHPTPNEPAPTLE